MMQKFEGKVSQCKCVSVVPMEKFWYQRLQATCQSVKNLAITLQWAVLGEKGWQWLVGGWGVEEGQEIVMLRYWDLLLGQWSYCGGPLGQTVVSTTLVFIKCMLFRKEKETHIWSAFWKFNPKKIRFIKFQLQLIQVKIHSSCPTNSSISRYLATEGHKSVGDVSSLSIRNCSASRRHGLDQVVNHFP